MALDVIVCIKYQKKIKSFYLRELFTSVYLRHSPYICICFDLNTESAFFFYTQLCPGLDNIYGISFILTYFYRKTRNPGSFWGEILMRRMKYVQQISVMRTSKRPKQGKGKRGEQENCTTWQQGGPGPKWSWAEGSSRWILGTKAVVLLCFECWILSPGSCVRQDL